MSSAPEATVERGANESPAILSDGRGSLRKWWDRRTKPPLVGKPDSWFICRTHVVLSFTDRLLVLFGRDVVVVTFSDVEPHLNDPHVYSMIDSIHTQAGTRPHGQ